MKRADEFERCGECDLRLEARKAPIDGEQHFACPEHGFEHVERVPVADVTEARLAFEQAKVRAMAEPVRAAA